MSRSPDSEPRRDLRQILSALVTGLVRVTPDRDLQAVFEQELQQLLSMRSVRLREIPTRYQARLVTPTRTTDSIVLGVPSANPRVQAVLEAYFEPGRPIEDRDYETLESAAALGGLVLEAARTRTAVRARRPDGAAPLIGSTPVMRDLRDRIERVAMTDFTVLIDGESGVGKELVAHQLHDLGRRRYGPFIAVNCAAVVETLLEAELFGIEDRTATGVRGRRGKFEHADNGTLFLDEVSDLALTAQAKLLRAIQDLSVERVGGNGARRVNTRIVAATNRPLGELVARGLFRADLFYRLSGVEIHVPALRHRREDIEELSAYFLTRHRHTRDLRMSFAALEALRYYHWPGNVRELERLIERTVTLAESDEIELDDLPSQVRGQYGEVLAPSAVANESLRAWGSRYVRLVYERCGRNKRRACRRLDISYHTLQAYLRYYDGGQGDAPRQIPGWARLPERTRQNAELVEVTRRFLDIARFFIVFPVVPRAMLLAFGAATLVGGAALALSAEHPIRTVAPVLLLQLFAAASGFVVPARRGYYDLLLTRGDSRVAIAAVHWAMSVLPGILSWLALAAVERLSGGASLLAPGTLLALFVVSTGPWVLTVPLPRLTGAIAWLLVFALAAAAFPESRASPASLLLPWALLATRPHPFAAAIVVTCIAAAMAAAFAWINRMDLPLESGQ